MAASGGLAPRAHEQLSLLILLLDDPEIDVRETARQTIEAIAEDAIRAFLGRPDVPIGVREYFADRGVFPAEIPAITGDEPLIDTQPDLEITVPEVVDDVVRTSLVQQVSKMGFSARMKAALKGPREVRAILIRDPNKLIASSVLSSSKVTGSEVEAFSRMTNVSEDVLRIIAASRTWTKNYGVVVGLTRNPKTPLGLSMNLMSRLNDRDLASLSTDRNVPDALRTAARRRVALGETR